MLVSKRSCKYGNNIQPSFQCTPYWNSGVPAQYIQAGKNAPVSLVINQQGDQFSVETKTGPQSWIDNFEIGKPAKITGPGRKQMDVRGVWGFSGT